MRYGIFSDIHANLEALERILEAYAKEAIDQYLCAGDVVGYAADPKECIEKIRANKMIVVAGNHDYAGVGLFSPDYFNPFAKEAVYWTQRNLDSPGRNFLRNLKLIYKNDDLTMVHGTLDEPPDFNYMTDGYIASRTFSLLENNLCFVGHTHRVEVFIQDKDGRISYQNDVTVNIIKGNKYIINVGSAGQPRDGNPRAAYCIYDTDKKIVQIKRIDYDIGTSRIKISLAGLPRFLGDRLVAGR